MKSMTVLEGLGLTEVADFLPQSAVDALLDGLGDAALETLTFGDLSADVTGESEQVTAFTDRKDRVQAPQASKVVAARLRRWFNWVLSPAQDVLVDAPHLATRYPSLLGGEVGSIDAWNEAAALPTIDHAIRTDLIQPQRAVAGDWSDRPRWFWTLLQAEKTVQEVANPFEARTAPFAFCEDLSMFVERPDAREFSSDLRPPFSRRFVSRNPDDGFGATVAYRPQSRLDS